MLKKNLYAGCMWKKSQSLLNSHHGWIMCREWSAAMWWWGYLVTAATDAQWVASVSDMYTHVGMTWHIHVHVAGRYGEDFVEKRREKLQRWSNRIARHPVISRSDVFIHFIHCDDEGVSYTHTHSCAHMSYTYTYTCVCHKIFPLHCTSNSIGLFQFLEFNLSCIWNISTPHTLWVSDWH